MTSATSGQIEFEHVHRYCLAREYCRGKKVVDVASGEGYGSALLAQVAESVVGIEISPDAVLHASRSFVRPNLRFALGDARALPIGDGEVDVVVSFETIEHLLEHEIFISEVQRILSADGIFIVSSPDRDVYSAGAWVNPHHVNELTKDEFTKLIASRFSCHQFLQQRPMIGSAIFAVDGDTSGALTFERRNMDYLEASQGLSRAPYLIAVASNAPIEPRGHSVYIDYRSVNDAIQSDGIERLEREIERNKAEIQYLQKAADHARGSLWKQARELNDELKTQVRGLHEELNEQARVDKMRVLDLLTLIAEIRPLAAETRRRNWLQVILGRLKSGIAASARMPAARRDSKALASRLLEPPSLFDVAWYLDQYPDVRASNVPPLLHYLRWGAKEGRDPHPNFKTQYYLDQYPDVRASGINPLVHYLEYGAKEGRVTRPPDREEAPHDAPDLAVAGRRAYLAEGFDPHWYRRAYEDAAASDLDPHEHYLRFGYLDGRPATPWAASTPPLLPHALQFEKCLDPEVTIIIPVYKHHVDTLRCLHSIMQDTINIVSYEIIVADDCPTDPTDPHLAEAQGITVLSQPENLGFIRNCNSAAKHARGKYIVFLNNDTLVREGWLNNLVDVARRDEKVGMVGAKLLNADGTIQEAGGVIFQNGWGYPYGRGDDPFDAKYNYVREVDVVTGACFLVRKDLFDELGPLRDDFAPAFYEEFDLAFVFADHGYKIVYQPASALYHLGSESYGPEVRNRQSVINHEKFCARWSERLALHAVDQRSIFRARERQPRSGTILIIDDFVPQYDKHAGALTTFQYINLLLNEGFKVIFIPDVRVAIEPYVGHLQQLGVEVLYDLPDFEGWLEQAGLWLDWVWVARPNVAPKYIEPIRRLSRAPIVYYTHDLHFLREMRRYELFRHPEALEMAESLRETEIRLFQQVDCVTTPSLAEADVIAKLVPHAVVKVLQPYFYKQDTKASVADLGSRRGILFVGGFSHAPNVDAALWLVGEIMPLVWQQIPDAKVMIVGSNPPPEVMQLAGPLVEVPGHVPDISFYYARARLSLSPLRYGAGVKGKVVASLEAGVPVVTTPVGNEGIELLHGAEAMIGTTTSQLADHVLQLFNDDDLLRRLSDNGLKVVRERFSEQSAKAGFLDALRAATRHHSRGELDARS
nr:glycosyltransferase [Ancylobacter tetraedralis]